MRFSLFYPFPLGFQTSCSRNLAPGATVLLDKLPDMDPDSPTNSLTAQQIGLIVEAFKAWPFAPDVRFSFPPSHILSLNKHHAHRSLHQSPSRSFATKQRKSDKKSILHEKQVQLSSPQINIYAHVRGAKEGGYIIFTVIIHPQLVFYDQ